MDQPYFQVSSITHATRGRDLLTKKGIPAYIQRTSHPDTKEGCGYSIYFRGDADEAERLLRMAQVRILGRGTS